MRHGKRGRKLGRTASHRRAMFGNMATSLFESGSIRTTVSKAKELRSIAERLITFAKRGDLHARRQVLRRIQNKLIVSKLFEEIAPKLLDRKGGYVRLVRVGPRRGDSTEICLVELVGNEVKSGDAQGESTQVEAKEGSGSKARKRPQKQKASDVVSEESVSEFPEQGDSSAEDENTSVQKSQIKNLKHSDDKDKNATRKEKET